MSDFPRGDGWWEASDGKWYAPELHPDFRAPAAPNLEQFQPPSPGDRLEMPGLAPPSGGGAGGFAGSDLGSGPPQRYPVVPQKKRSTGQILAFVFGGLFLLMAGGCGVFIWAFRDEIADATIDFTDAVPVDDVGSCQVVGVDLGDDYEIEATLSAESASVESHYRVDFEIVTSGETVVGADVAVFRNMTPGEDRTEDVFNTINAADGIDVSCKVTGVVRIDA